VHTSARAPGARGMLAARLLLRARPPALARSALLRFAAPRFVSAPPSSPPPVSPPPPPSPSAAAAAEAAARADLSRGSLFSVLRGVLRIGSAVRRDRAAAAEPSASAAAPAAGSGAAAGGAAAAAPSPGSSSSSSGSIASPASVSAAAPALTRVALARLLDLLRPEVRGVLLGSFCAHSSPSSRVLLFPCARVRATTPCHRLLARRARRSPAR